MLKSAPVEVSSEADTVPIVIVTIEKLAAIFVSSLRRRQPLGQTRDLVTHVMTVWSHEVKSHYCVSNSIVATVPESNTEQKPDPVMVTVSPPPGFQSLRG
jgi:hypothetical protein